MAMAQPTALSIPVLSPKAKAEPTMTTARLAAPSLASDRPSVRRRLANRDGRRSSLHARRRSPRPRRSARRRSRRARTGRDRRGSGIAPVGNGTPPKKFERRPNVGFARLERQRRRRGRRVAARGVALLPARLEAVVFDFWVNDASTPFCELARTCVHVFKGLHICPKHRCCAVAVEYQRQMLGAISSEPKLLLIHNHPTFHSALPSKQMSRAGPNITTTNIMARPRMIV